MSWIRMFSLNEITTVNYVFNCSKPLASHWLDHIRACSRLLISTQFFIKFLSVFLLQNVCFKYNSIFRLGRHKEDLSNVYIIANGYNYGLTKQFWLTNTLLTHRNVR